MGLTLNSSSILVIVVVWAGLASTLAVTITLSRSRSRRCLGSPGSSTVQKLFGGATATSQAPDSALVDQRDMHCEAEPVFHHLTRYCSLIPRWLFVRVDCA